MNTAIENYLILRDRGFLCTVSKKSVPTIVPICFVYHNGKIYTAIDEKPKKTKYLARIRNIRYNNKVAFIVDNYTNDWTKLSYCLIHAKARIVVNRKERKTAVELLVNKYPQYRFLKMKSPVIIALDIESAKFWTFSKD